jgi:hypothetical protein
MATQQNYQPQVGNTNNGPHIHTYIPRSDGSISIGGVSYIPASGVPTATTTAVPVAVTPIPAAPAIAQPYIIPPGRPAIPAMIPVPLTSQFFPSYYPFDYYSYLQNLHVHYKPASAFYLLHPNSEALS